MHEFGIAQGLLETVLAKAKEIDAVRIESIKLQIGVLSGIEEDALRFAFTALAGGTPAETAQLVVEKIPLCCYCEPCGHTFECRPSAYHCPGCGGVSSDVRSGRELKLVSMEVS